MQSQSKIAAAAAYDTSPPLPKTPSIRRRLAGMLYESLLLLGVLSVTFMVPHLVLGVAWNLAAPEWLLWLHIFLVLLAYFVWFWRKSGQTLAMQTWKIKVVGGDNAARISLRQALLRYALSWPSLLLFGVGILWALFDRDRQFLHDRLAGTRIVRV